MNNVNFLARSNVYIKLMFAAGAKVSAAFIAFVLTVLITRNLSSVEAGMFLLGLTLITVLSIFLRLGLDNVILRFLSAHNSIAFSQQKLNRGLVWVALASIPTTLLGMLFSQKIAVNVFGKPDFAEILFWILPAVIPLTVYSLLSVAFQAQHKVILTTIFQNLGVSALFVVALSAGVYGGFLTVDAVIASKIFTVSSILVLLLGFFFWFRQKEVSFSLHELRDPELSSAGLNLWVASTMTLAVQWSGIVIAGAIIPSEEVALLAAAQRTALLISFVLMVVNMVIAPRYARLWEEKELYKIQVLARLSTRIMIILVLPLVIFMIIFSTEVMSLFGVGYGVGGELLVVLSVGQFVNVATGSLGYLLNMTGHESTFKSITIKSGCISIALSILLINMYGALGAAYSITLGGVTLNVLGLIAVRKKLKFWMAI